VIEGHLYEKEMITLTPVKSAPDGKRWKKGTNRKKYRLSPKIADDAWRFTVRLIVVGKRPIGILHSDGTYDLDY